MIKRWELALLLLWVTSLLAAVAWVTCQPLQPTMPVYLDLAARLRTGPVVSSFEPLGYPWLISLMPMRDLDDAAKLLHLLSYVVLGGAVTTLGMAEIGRATGGTASATPRALAVLTLSGLLIAHPYVIVNLVRLNDNSVSVTIVAVLFAWVARAAAMTWSYPVVAGLLLGVLAQVRPNALSLIPFFAFDLAGGTLPFSRPRLAAMRVVVFLVAMVAVSVSLSVAVAERPFQWPANGPYNAFAGNNPFSMKALKADYNGEPSLAEGLGWCGVSVPPRDAKASVLSDCTVRFVIQYPLQAGALAAYKSYNLMFRPNLRLAESSVTRAAQILMVGLPAIWWACGLWSLFRTGHLLDRRAMSFVILYALPFVVTNSDPRFRLPLDAVYVVSLITHVDRIAPTWVRRVIRRTADV